MYSTSNISRRNEHVCFVITLVELLLSMNNEVRCVLLRCSCFYILYQSRTQSPQSSRSRKEGLWHNPFVFPTNPGDPVLLRMCKVFQDGGHANRNTHYIFISGRKYEEFFVVLLSFLHNAIYSINYIYSVVTLFKKSMSDSL